MNLKLILFVRLCMCVLSVSWYVPDETWQSVEVAHNMVYNTGKKTVVFFPLSLLKHLKPAVFGVAILFY